MKQLFIAFLALTLFACNKDQRAVKKLDGSWSATEYTISDGTTTENVLEDGTTLKFNFGGCKLKDDEYCNLTLTISDGEDATTSTGVYRVTNNGAKLETKENVAATEINVIEILELTKTTLKIRNSEDGYEENATFEKE